MYEMLFNGWTRTPENLKRTKEDKWYRFKLNFDLLYHGIKYRRWWHIKDLIINVLVNRNCF